MPEPTLTTARTLRHALPFLFAGQAQKEAFVNEALTRIDALLQPVVLDEATAPPAAPASGDSYLVADPAAGAWAGHERAIASWADTQWLFAVPCEGARVHDAASDSLAVFTAAHGWRRATAPTAPTGGATQDIEARAALAAIVAGLHRLGIFSA
jgi:hypothetical protein